MAQNYYDEFVKLPLDKMAQKMEDMTFLYHETRVPKKHYKEKLSVAVEEMIESSVEMNLIATYYRTLEELKKQNGKWFFQALLCLEVGVKPSTIKPSEYQALASLPNIDKAKVWEPEPATLYVWERSSTYSSAAA